jgi:hypothetical protein
LLGEFLGERLEAALEGVLPFSYAQCTGRGGSRGDGAGRGAADRPEAVGLGEFGDGPGIDDAAGDAAAHHEIAFELLPRLGHGNLHA